MASSFKNISHIPSFLNESNRRRIQITYRLTGPTVFKMQNLDCDPLGYDNVQSGTLLAMFREYLLLPSSDHKISGVKVESAAYSETLVTTYRTTHCHNPEGHIYNKVHRSSPCPNISSALTSNTFNLHYFWRLIHVKKFIVLQAYILIPIIQNREFLGISGIFTFQSRNWFLQSLSFDFIRSNVVSLLVHRRYRSTEDWAT